MSSPREQAKLSSPSVHPLQAVAEAEESCRRTHYLSTFITKAQCFLMSASIPIRGEELKKILGIRVQFKNQSCDRFCHRCRDCGVCSHLYTCSCSDFYKEKIKNTSWCAHIHAMHSLTKDRFKEKACLYIHTDIRYMVVRHVRAFIQGEKFMTPVLSKPGCFDESVDNFDMSSKYRVQFQKNEGDCKCTPYDECKFCEGCIKCQYSCSCPDFDTDKKVCQHIHNVIMVKQEHSFSNLELPIVDIGYSLIVTEDRNMEYYVALEHEMSFYIDLKSIEKQKGPPPNDPDPNNFVEFSYRVGVHVRNVDSESPKEEDSIEESWWIIYRESKSFLFEKKEECRVKSNFNLTKNTTCRKGLCIGASSCFRCGICCRHYTCNCPLNRFIICRHVHALLRMLNNSRETEKASEAYIDKCLPLARRNDYLPGVENRPLSFPREDPPSGAGPSSQMDILPPPTD